MSAIFIQPLLKPKARRAAASGMWGWVAGEDGRLAYYYNN